MDINKLFKAGMRSCGSVLRLLPEKEIGSPMKYMTGVLEDVTLPRLDILLPRLEDITFPIRALIKVDDGDSLFQDSSFVEMLSSNDSDNRPGHSMDSRYSAFRIPKPITGGSDIMGLKGWHLAYSNSGSGLCSNTRLSNVALPNRYGRYSSADVYGQSLSGVISYADAQLMGTMIPSLRLKFRQPNILFINKPYADDSATFITVSFKLKNDSNLMSIGDNSFISVKELFILDLKASIYGEYGMFDEIETTTGTSVKLGIDSWSNCEQEADDKFNEKLATAHYRNSSMMSG